MTAPILATPRGRSTAPRRAGTAGWRCPLDELLSPKAIEWRDKARDLAERVVRPLAAKYDREQTYPWEIRDALAEAGMFGVWIPEEYGGHGGGVMELPVCRRGFPL